MTPLLDIAALFGRLSLLAVGGANATVPEIAREVVGVRHWMPPATFAQLYALSNAAPGPNVMISTVVGAHQAGVAGGVVATVAMVLPAAALAVLVAGVFARHAHARWQSVVRAALLPITAGLVLAAAATLLRESDTGWVTAAISAATALAAYKTRAHPLLLFGAGAAVGIVLGG